MHACIVIFNKLYSANIVKEPIKGQEIALYIKCSPRQEYFVPEAHFETVIVLTYNYVTLKINWFFYKTVIRAAC